MQTQLTVSITVQELRDLVQLAIREELAKNNQAEQVTEKPKYLKRREVCALLGISLGSLAKYIKRGDIPARRIGNRILIQESDVRASVKVINTIKGSRKNYQQ